MKFLNIANFSIARRLPSSNGYINTLSKILSIIVLLWHGKPSRVFTSTDPWHVVRDDQMQLDGTDGDFETVYNDGFSINV